MSDEQGLLAAIWADPHDDTPRLVYADWLDENERPHRAEFIRLQCQLARLDEWDETTRPALVKREHALWKKYAKDWKAALPKLVQTAGFARGFPAPRVRAMASSKFLKLRAAEFAAAPLWWFSFPPAPGSIVKLLACPHLLRLGTLSFGEGWLTPRPTVKAFVMSANVRNLAALDLSRTYQFGNDGFAALGDGAANLPHLRTLNLSVCWASDRGAARLAESPLAAQLTTLDLSGNDEMKSGAMEAVFAPGHFPTLTNLSTPSTIGVAGLAAVSKSSPTFGLRRLSIYVEEKANLKAFAAWPGLQSVRELDLKNSLIRDRIGTLFASPYLRNLRVLRMEVMGNRPADLKAFEELAAGSLLPGLRELRLQHARYVLEPVADKLWERFDTNLHHDMAHT